MCRHQITYEIKGSLVGWLAAGVALFGAVLDLPRNSIPESSAEGKRGVTLKQ